MAKFLQVLRDIVLLIVRIGLGAIMVTHGWRRWQVEGMAKQIEYLQQFHTPYPEVAAWGGTLLELVGGIFLIVGALTPLVALAFLVEAILIVSYTSWYRGVYVDKGGYEYTIALGLLALVLMVFGAGRASIDQLFRRGKSEDEDLVDERTPA
ncbi:DoxX family protein [Microlunatus panaciterrae]|uniref:Oxidoreductase n=1 Tax=Microlunatus panaciterrae TaxID=400768 RepID=A0ABS2RK94_9ACTN|nr:DoxX family protein [Microlunatus panaciterrae]MBM7798586.1 putative oxidoreductase [Microlunatus panaciterrae]